MELILEKYALNSVRNTLSKTKYHLIPSLKKSFKQRLSLATLNIKDDVLPYNFNFFLFQA